jgi:hypothetical protein
LLLGENCLTSPKFLSLQLGDWHDDITIGGILNVLGLGCLLHANAGRSVIRGDI